MENKIKDTRTMIRYLLGELSEEEQTNVEEQYLTNANYFEQLLDLEDELIYQYVHEKLSQQDRQRLERHFLASPERREKVKLAKTVIEYNAREQSVKKWSVAQLLESVASGWRLPVIIEKPAVQWLFASVLIIVALGSIWLIIKNNELGHQLTQLKTNQHRVLQLFEQQRDSVNQLAKKLEHELKQHTDLQQELDKMRLREQIWTEVNIEPQSGVTMGSSKLKTLEITQNKILVNIKLFFTVRDTTISYYRAELLVEEEKIVEILSLNKLQAHSKGLVEAVTFQVPGSVFLNGNYRYLVFLKGITTASDTLVIKDYHFRITKK